MAADRYELLERIATGGMAEVFRARATGEHGFEKTLAIKRILPSLASDEEFVARFIAEAKLAVALTHTNVVQIFDFGRFAGSLYIAMEFVEGGDLANLLRAVATADQLLPPSVALFVAIELAKGLDYAHQRSAQPVIHRDISPSNILLSYAGEVKIADFGIAQAVEHARLITDSRIMGKWRYMSPEQARGEALDERTDIFSAGSVMFEMFTGRKLVPGGEVEAVVRNLQEMSWPAPSSLRPDLPRELDDVLARALRRDPRERYRHIEELMEALTEVSYSRSVRTSSLELAELVRDLLPRRELVTTTRGRANILDDIIRSEIGVKDGSAVRRTLATETPPGNSGPELRTKPLRPTPAAGAPAHAAPAFEPGETDERGITTWRLVADQAAPAAPSRRRTAVQIGFALAFVASAAAAVLTISDRGRPLAPPIPVPQALLVVESKPPGAELLVDGRPTGLRTPVDGVSLPAGQHRVVLRLAGYPLWESTQTFRPGETVRLAEIALEREPRVLAIGGEPLGATVRVDGVLRGTTPAEVPDLAPGRHDVLLELRGYEPLREQVSVADSGRTDFAPTLRESRKYGKVSLNADVWANVYVDDARKPFCSTPCLEKPLEAGRHKLRFESPLLGKSVSATIEVLPGRTSVMYDIVLARK